MVLTIGAVIMYQRIPASTNVASPSPTPTVRVSTGPLPAIPLILPAGFVVHVFADGLGSPRDLVESPGGTILVSDPNAGLVYALPDRNRQGRAVTNKVVISDTHRPHGLAFYQGKLYVAEVDRVVRYDWNEVGLTASNPKVLFGLPENHDHNNRTIAFDRSGKMYVSVGSTCNVCREDSPLSATVIVSDAAGRHHQVMATGLRNAAFIQVNPQTGELWGTEMGRDYLGDDLPPDEINIIRPGQDYGWPYCYGERVHDDVFDPQSTHSCQATQIPVDLIPAHSAPLGLVFIQSSQFPSAWQGDLLVAYHGSWNRSVPVGYRVVHLKVNKNTIGAVGDFVTGFLPPGATDGPSAARGRPVDLLFDRAGNLYLSDDKSGSVYIIQHPGR